MRKFFKKHKFPFLVAGAMIVSVVFFNIAKRYVGETFAFLGIVAIIAAGALLYMYVIDIEPRIAKRAADEQVEPYSDLE